MFLKGCNYHVLLEQEMSQRAAYGEDLASCNVVVSVFRAMNGEAHMREIFSNCEWPLERGVRVILGQLATGTRLAKLEQAWIVIETFLIDVG